MGAGRLSFDVVSASWMRYADVAQIAKPSIAYPVALESRSVLLEPLSLKHLDDFCAEGLDPELWRWTMISVREPAGMRSYIEKALEDARAGTAAPFAIIARSTGHAVGSTRYGNIASEHRRLEIGWTWLSRAWQRTPFNTETKYLLLRHAFEALGCIRVEFKADVLNLRSREALRRVGAVEEGIFRHHLITDTGRIRDTVYYSIIDRDWPEVKKLLEAKIARPWRDHP